MSVKFMKSLESLRTIYGQPMKVTSAYRCPRHNAAVSSTGATGPHTTGCAVDVSIAGEAAYKLVALAVTMGFTGIGIKQSGPWPGRFIHLDTLTDNRPRIWSY